MTHRSVLRLTLALSLSILTGCSVNQPKPEEKLDITVSILPQQYFVQKIGGDKVNVNVMVEPGIEPHVYEPRPQPLKALSDAEAYISVGMEFEHSWLDKFRSVNPKMLMIDSAQGVDKITMVEDHHHHDHGGEEKTQEETLDPHIWLSPQAVKVQAQNIYQGLVKLDPDNQEQYQANLTQFITEIDQLDQEIRQNLQGVKQRKFMVFHPSWGYFARDYNLEQIPIEIGGQEPSAAELGKFVKAAKKENIQVIFIQPQMNSRKVETLAQEIKGEVIVIDPLSPNWSENLRQASQIFSEEL